MATAAERQARCRRRRRRGEIPLHIPVHESVVLAMLESNRLTEAEALDKAKLQEGVVEVLLGGRGAGSNSVTA